MSEPIKYVQWNGLSSVSQVLEFFERPSVISICYDFDSCVLRVEMREQSPLLYTLAEGDYLIYFPPNHFKAVKKQDFEAFVRQN